MPNPPITIVPNTGQSLAATRDPIRINFNTINVDFAVDHVGYGSSANEGKHNQITFPAHTGAIAFLAGEIGLFNQTASPTGVPDIWMKRGVASAIPITGSLQAASGWSYLPSGILIKWGRVNVSLANGTWRQESYPTGANIPVFTNVFNVTVQAISQDTPPGSQTQTFNYLTVASGGGGTTNFNVAYFWWIPRTNFGNVNQQSIFYYAIGN